MLQKFAVTDLTDGKVYRCHGCKKVKSSHEFYAHARKKICPVRLCRTCKRKEWRSLRSRVATRFSLVKSSAKKHHREFALTMEQFDELTSHQCTYCDGDLPISGSGLDRLDNTGGYTIKNVVPCCAACNRIRSDYFSVEEMQVIVGSAVKRVREYRQGKV